MAAIASVVDQISEHWEKPSHFFVQIINLDLSFFSRSAFFWQWQLRQQNNRPIPPSFFSRGSSKRVYSSGKKKKKKAFFLDTAFISCLFDPLQPTMPSPHCRLHRHRRGNSSPWLAFRVALVLVALLVTSPPTPADARILGQDVYFVVSAYLDTSVDPQSRCGVQNPVGELTEK